MASARRSVPEQLPADVPSFTGRGTELTQLDTLLSGNETTAVVISAVSGTAGVGKTALAIRWAHRVRERFPDGQLYVNLRGYDPDQPMSPAEALAGFLSGLGVADVPLTLDERAARFRTEISGRRLLLVLDNAAAVEQVRPLLPGTPSCAVLVTSRDSMAGLVALHGAERLSLDLLPAADAQALLRRLIGSRADAEPDALAELAGLCVRLPLALRVAAELAASRPFAQLATLVAELSDQQRRLDLLHADGDPRAAVTAVFSWSVRHLPTEAARTFALLGLHPGPSFEAYAAAALAGTDLAQARLTLERLARAHLIHPLGRHRYGMHDLLRAYAQRLAGTPDTALNRLFDYYLATSAAAMDTLHPAEKHRRPRVPPAATDHPALDDPDAAREWLDAERPTLVSVTAYGATHDRPAHSIQLSSTLFRYLAGGHYADALTVHGHALRAARESGDRSAEAQELNNLGVVHWNLSQYGPAAEHLRQALDLFQQAGDHDGEARTLGNLGAVEMQHGRYGPAADHQEQALKLFQQTGDLTGEARTLGNLAMISCQLGNFSSAAGHFVQALSLYRQTGDTAGETWALINLGLVEVRLGSYASAADRLNHALSLARHLGNRVFEASAKDSLGTVHTRLGEPEEGAGLHGEALALFREAGDLDGQTWALNGLGEAVQAANRPTDALSHHDDALTIATETGIRDQQARAHAGLALAHQTLGHPSDAREHYEQALAIYTDLGMPEAEEIRTHLASTGGPSIP
jgi:tetratricopeptide (TPR) repeat protein